MDTIPIEHPGWCDRQHAEGFPVHSADVGEQDIELGGDKVDLSVNLYQDRHNAAQVWLCEHDHDNTAVTVLTAEQAEALGRRLIEAAGRLTGRAALDEVDLLTGRAERMLWEHRFALRARHGEAANGNSGPGGPL